jgi:hypothetical protein
MTTYIALFNLTDAGIKAAKESPRRLDAAKKLLAGMGGEMKQFYLVILGVSMDWREPPHRGGLPRRGRSMAVTIFQFFSLVPPLQGASGPP